MEALLHVAADEARLRLAGLSRPPGRPGMALRKPGECGAHGVRRQTHRPDAPRERRGRRRRRHRHIGRHAGHQVRPAVGHGGSCCQGAAGRRGAVLSARQQAGAAGGAAGADLRRQERHGGATGRGRPLLSARHAVPEVALGEIRQAREQMAGGVPVGGRRSGAAEAVRRLDLPGARRDHHHADATPRRHHPEGCGLRSGHAAAADRSAADAGDPGAPDQG